MTAFNSPQDGPGGAKRSKRPSATCTTCGEPLKKVRIIYGYPTPEAFERAERGELAIGGCLVGDDEPKWACRACGAPVPAQARAGSIG